ncbi:MAG: DnaJ domain-containing protein [bacterium]|nr:DnaJ domain-containing protein [bacterium]
MLEDIKRWLATQLIAINSVRHCTIRREETRDPERDPSLIVHTWSGLFIHVFVLPELIKPRTLKRLISEGTRCGVGTLFLVDSALLPPDGERFIPDDTLNMLHALYKDRVYTYRVHDDGPHIGQVHFKAFGRSEAEVWYGPDVRIANLPSYRVWIKHPSLIKGDWLIAYFGTEAFWRNAETSAAREAFRRQYHRQNGQSWHFAWDAGSSWAAAGGERVETPSEPAPRPESKLDRSFAALGLNGAEDEPAVKAAFRQLARELHPDVSTLPKDEAEARFKVINEAYTYIKMHKRW